MYLSVEMWVCSFLSHQLSEEICLYRTTDHTLLEYCGRVPIAMQRVDKVSVVVGYSASCKYHSNVMYVM